MHPRQAERQLPGDQRPRNGAVLSEQLRALEPRRALLVPLHLLSRGPSSLPVEFSSV